MFRFNNLKFDTSILEYRDKERKPLPEHLVAIDQFSGQDFNLNDAGWIRNDLSAAVRAQSLTEYQAIVNRLVEIKQKGGIPDDMPLDEAISQIKPRWAQSPNELEIFMQMTNDGAYARLQDAYDKATAGKIRTDESPSVVTAADNGDS